VEKGSDKGAKNFNLLLRRIMLKIFMTQHEQVIELMTQNGGFATLGYLNGAIDVSGWKTKTPFATIRRIVQDERFFFKIKPGLWALRSFKEEVLSRFNIGDQKNSKIQEEFTHSYYQGFNFRNRKFNRYFRIHLSGSLT
jgi:hypothetical protein